MTDKIKKLEDQLEAATDDIEKIHLLNCLAEKLRDSEPKQALKYGQQALSSAQSLSQLKEEADSFCNIGVCHITLANYGDALYHLSNALRIYKSLNEKNEQAFVINRMGVVYYRLSDYKSALELFSEGLKISEEVGDRVLEGRSLNAIGAIHFELEDHEKAIDYYSRSIELCHAENYPRGEAIALSNLGNVYQKSKDYEKAIEYHLKSLHIYEANNDNPFREGIGITLENLGDDYFYQGDYEKAVEYYQRSLNVVREVGAKDAEGNVLSSFGRLLLTQERYDESLESLQTALEIAQKVDDKKLTSEIHESLSQVYEALDQPAKALKHYKEFYDLKQIILNEDVKNAQIRYAVHQKEKEAEIYRLKNVELVELNEQLEESYQQLVETQLKLIQSQAQRVETEKLATLGELAGMVGHEMNNALSGIAGPIEEIINSPPLDEEKIWQCWESDQEGYELQNYIGFWNKNWQKIKEAAHMIQRAARRSQIVVQDLQNIAGSRSRKLGPVDVSQVFREAVRLQKQRFMNIDVIEDFDEGPLEIICTRGEVGQIFMNLSNNASKALEDRMNPKIEVGIHQKNGGIEIKFGDNGCGMSPEVRDHLFDPFFTTQSLGKGLGMSTVKRILKDYGGSIKVESEEGVGTTFIIYIPYDGKGKESNFIK